MNGWLILNIVLKKAPKHSHENSTTGRIGQFFGRHNALPAIPVPEQTSRLSVGNALCKPCRVLTHWFLLWAAGKTYSAVRLDAVFGYRPTGWLHNLFGFFVGNFSTCQTRTIFAGHVLCLPEYYGRRRPLCTWLFNQ